METQTRLSRHNKFISAENIVGIFSVSSDDSFTCSVLSQIVYILCLMDVFIFLCICIYMYTYIFLLMYIFKCIYLYLYVYMYMYIYVYVYIVYIFCD